MSSKPCTKCGGTGLGMKELTGATDFYTPLCDRCNGSRVEPEAKSRAF